MSPSNLEEFQVYIWGALVAVVLPAAWKLVKAAGAVAHAWLGRIKRKLDDDGTGERDK